jgi:hypothetical protein
VPGIGKILVLVLLYEIHDIHRFPRVQDFVSYCRLVKCAKQSDGTPYGDSGNKIGNAHLKWAFSEAALLCLRQNPAAQQYAFLVLNGFEIDAPVDDQERLMLDLAAGRIGRSHLTDWLRQHLKPLA